MRVMLSSEGIYMAQGGGILSFVSEGELPSVSIELDERLLEQLDVMVGTMKTWPAVRELGVVVTRETAARVALVRGLEALARTKPVANPIISSAPVSEPAETSAPAEPYVLDTDGFVVPPDGWERAPDTETVPALHGSAHDYYTQNGWDRYWGKAGTEVIYFYWARDPSLHALDPASGVRVQDTPWGPGHFIPHNYVPDA